MAKWRDADGACANAIVKDPSGGSQYCHTMQERGKLESDHVRQAFQPIGLASWFRVSRDSESDISTRHLHVFFGHSAFRSHPGEVRDDRRHRQDDGIISIKPS